MHNKLICLGYHSISDPRNMKELEGGTYTHLSVPRIVFEQEMEYLLENGYTPLQFRDLVAIKEGRDLLPKKAVIICFDDGYKDNIRNAYPVLKQLGMRAVIFPVSDFIDKIALPHWAGRIRAEHSNIFLSWEDLSTMQDIFEIGTHTKTHRKLTKVHFQEIRQELFLSRDSIERHTGVRPIVASFPHSSSNENVRAVAKELGFTFCMGVGRGYNYVPLNTFLKKIPISSQDTFKYFRWKIEHYPLIHVAERVSGRLRRVLSAIRP